MSDERVHIWSNGTEFLIWDDNNCDRCIKRAVCDLSDAITEAYFGDGTFAPEIAARLGVPEDGRLEWWCKERRTEEQGPDPACVEMARMGAARLPGFDGLAKGTAP